MSVWLHGLSCFLSDTTKSKIKPAPTTGSPDNNDVPSDRTAAGENCLSGVGNSRLEKGSAGISEGKGVEKDAVKLENIGGTMKGECLDSV